MNKCFAPAVFHLSCHLGSDYANLLPFCSHSFFFYLLFLCRLFLFLRRHIFFYYFFYEKKIYVSADMKFMVCFGLSRATYLIVLCSFFVASRIIEYLIVNGMYVIDILFHSDGGKGEKMTK